MTEQSVWLANLPVLNVNDLLESENSRVVIGDVLNVLKVLKVPKVLEVPKVLGVLEVPDNSRVQPTMRGTVRPAGTSRTPRTLGTYFLILSRLMRSAYRCASLVFR